jgi:SAM-dependent methyltransferase
VVDFLAGEPAGRILDVGTGNSPFLPAMRQLGWEVAGTEMDASFVEYFRSHYQIELFQGELEDAQFSSDYFDVVTIMGVLEHVPHPRLFMEEVGRILKDGGVVCLWCFNRSIEAGLLGRYWLGFDAPRHLYSFSYETLGRLLAETGFKVEKSYFRPISYLAYSAVWAAARLGDRWKGQSRPVYLPRLPAPLQLLSLPLASVLARLGKSSNVYVSARKL